METAEFNKLCEESFDLKRKIEAIEKGELDSLEKQLYAVDNKILAELDAMEVNSFRSSAGLVIKTRRWSWQTPKSREAKEKFFAWLKEKGDEVYYQYMTVNSQSLNSLAKAELEAAKEREDLDFAIPGLPDPTFQDSISRRAAK